MKKIIFAITCVFFSTSFAQLTINETVLQQINSRFSEGFVLRKNSGTKSSKQENTYIYIAKSKKKIVSSKKFDAKKVGDFYRLSAKKQKRINIHVPEADLREQAYGSIADFLPEEISSNCGITAVGYEYEQIDMREPRVVGSTILIHQVIDGLAVRDESYVLMKYDSTGALSYADVNWVNYDKSLAKSTTSNSKRKTIHINELNETVQTISEEFKEKDISGEIYTSAPTLIAIIDERGNTVLVPGVTYVGNAFERESNRTTSFTIDLPSDASLIPQTKALVGK
ncbi:hypothetical protein [uncultured Fibrobacter sp.]|uniref:hypothetical protein n=1 Tax=uncultured Fibrobacter sp. TaxID=261512 RepID=UPI0025F51A2D|nr:hypothetical protein [uncultured Fibrobacter sp.]